MRARSETIAIAVAGQRIAGKLFLPAGAAHAMPGVLFVHGWGGWQGQHLAQARAIAELGCVCLTFDLRGHAETGAQYETVTREDNLHDVLAAYDVLIGRADVNRSFIGLVGGSYGAYLCALLLYLRQARLLALQAPALYKDDNWQSPKRRLHIDPDFAAYRRLSLRAEDNRALGACAQFLGDALVVESENDEIIPHPAVANYIGALVNAHSLTYRVIEGADHALSSETCGRAYLELLVSWFSDMMKEGACTDTSS